MAALNPPHSSAHSRRGLLIYSLAAVIVTLSLVGLKGLSTWAMDTYVYSLPFLGGLLESLELVEVSNVVVLALLGVGLGAATRWLVKPIRGWQRVVLLGVAAPLVFLSSYWVRQYLWIQEVAIASEIPPTQAEQVTDRLLQEATGHEGLVGFFIYTVRTPLLPTELSSLKSLDEDDQWFRSELTRHSGVEPGLFSLIFQVAGWGIRLFYIGLALITATIYFSRGSMWAEARRRPAPEKPSPPRSRRQATTQPHRSPSQPSRVRGKKSARPSPPTNP